MLKNRLLLILITCFLIACEKKEPQLPVFEEQMFVMGTMVNVSIYGETEKKSKKVFHDLLKDFKYMNVAWSPHKKGSLKRINSLLPLGAPFSIGPALKDMINQCTELYEQSEGMFNPAIGKLIDLWGFTQTELPAGPPPSKESIKALLAKNPIMTDMTISALNLESSNESTKLDFGAYAKGFGVDKAIDYLKSANVENAIINAGGDLRAIGSKGNSPWKIGIKHPRGNDVIASLEIKGDESVFTSGDYERFYEFEGKRYHHIIDPRNGYPVEHTTSVTVIHHNAAIADAAATSLFIAGPANWQRIAKNMSIDQVMLIDKSGKIHLTPKMQKRLTFITPDKHEFVLAAGFGE